MPQISATVRQPVVNKISELAAKEKRSFSEMVAVLLEKAVYEQSGTLKESDINTFIKGSDLQLAINRSGSSNNRGDQPSDPVQQ